jgi:RNA polymerase sigma-70 factor (ECF subfamily)
VQDVFVEAFFSLETYRGLAPFGHWLSRIATRVGYRHWGNKKKEPTTVPIQDWDAVVSDGVEKLGNSEAADLLFGLLSRMKDKDRIILTLVYFEDLDYAEVAERMGWNRAITRLKAHRARNRLRDLAKREGLLEALS